LASQQVVKLLLDQNRLFDCLQKLLVLLFGVLQEIRISQRFELTRAVLKPSHKFVALLVTDKIRLVIREVWVSLSYDNVWFELIQILHFKRV
jgi:hypothetical protein